MLGIADPRTLYNDYDSELIALWKAHFELKHKALEENENNPSVKPPKYSSLDEQVNACERMLM